MTENRIMSRAERIKTDYQTVVDYRATRDELYAKEFELSQIDKQIADLQEQRTVVAGEVGELATALAAAAPGAAVARTLLYQRTAIPHDRLI